LIYSFHKAIDQDFYSKTASWQVPPDVTYYDEHGKYIVDKDGNCDFESITDAMGGAECGDTIIVNSGDYYENNIVIKEGIHLVGEGDSVRIFFGDHIGMKIVGQDHKYNIQVIARSIDGEICSSLSNDFKIISTCEIKNIKICNDQNIYGGRGIYIDNSSPEISSCVFENCGHNNYMPGWGAVAISGDSYPVFRDCIFTGNEGTWGATITINASADEHPAGEFYNCRFIDNETESSIIYLGYVTPLDTTFRQSKFINCVIKGNTINDAPLIGLYGCYASVFSYCEISGNEIDDYRDEGVVYGQNAGARFYNCTLVDNHSSQYDDIPVFNLGLFYNSPLGANALTISRSIIAFNSDKAIATDEDYCSVNYTCFYDNTPEDTLWLSRGESNISVDPAFCDRGSGLLSLYNFSPCSSVDGGFIGSYGVGCIPDCDSVSLVNNELIVCPAGDADSLQVYVDFVDSVMTRTIASNEIWIQDPADDNLSFFIDGDKIYADSAATEENGWHTTITRKYSGGHYQDSLSVVLINEVIAKLPVTIKSPDYDADGEIGLSDFSVFGSTYGSCKGDSLYNDWSNFGADSCVGLNDFTIFVTHYGHYHEDTLGAMLASADIVSDMEVELNFNYNTTDDIVEAEVVIKNGGDYSVLAIILQVNSENLRFVQWRPEARYAKKTAAVPINRGGGKCIFIADFGSPKESSSISSFKMGTLIFRVENKKALGAERGTGHEENISLLVGEFLTKDGREAILKDMNIISGKDITYTDRLESNFPNPFNPVTTIEFSISRDSHVDLNIYDVSGRLIRTLIDGSKKMDNYSIKWNGRDNRNRPVASGVYFYRLKTENFTKSRKMVLLR
jgi:hypothetical protein